MDRHDRSIGLRPLVRAVLAGLTLSASTLACAQAAAQVGISQVKVKTLAVFGFKLNTDTPSSPLILATDGNYYGTTYRSRLGEGDGSVYRMTREGAVTIVHTFQVESFPMSVMQASDGRLYGTTGGGHAYLGSVFRLGLFGAFKTLHTFKGTDGSHPMAGLVQAIDGSLYGTTSEGADSVTGTIYRIAPDGTFTTLVTLPSKTISFPTGTLLQGDDGRLYGTSGGGRRQAGALFSIGLAGDLEVAYKFNGLTARDPRGGLKYTGAHDQMFGVYSEGGTSTARWGPAVFAIDAAAFTTLFSPRVDLPGDLTQLTVGPDGSTLYGFASVYALIGSVSTLYSLTTTGVVRTLATVDGYVLSAPTFAPDGALLDTTTDGEGFGTVFQVTGF
jgi:uncharacterized repeat protein (TIGR03803 family)